ncbi:MAG: dTDP-4-dehydrorhamnose 3,5-epimerase [Marinoscillum sp.]|jgi:dTDP-4-dehydrorhamnose 3,5-epimerase
MELFESYISDCKIFVPRVFEDHRGYFYEGFNQNTLKEKFGIDFNLVQINQSMSFRNVLRGLHFQLPPFDQAKLVSVIEGEVLDVAVDLRKDSPTFGEHVSVMLSSDNKKHFYIPRGFAHGFIVLSETAKFMYGVDNNYSPKHDAGLLFSDLDLNIDWKMDHEGVLISDKDSILPKFKDFKSPF